MTLSEYLESNRLTQAQFADLIGKSQGMVSHWINGRHQVEAADAKKIETVTKGAVLRHELRPDLFDPPTAPIGRVPVPAARNKARRSFEVINKKRPN
jgi:DNA-binding transcriptional regulator YdaS (Cro superfamily)